MERNFKTTTTTTKNGCTVGIPEGEEGGGKVLFKALITENFPNLRGEMDIQIRESHRTPKEFEPR